MLKKEKVKIFDSEEKMKKRKVRKETGRLEIVFYGENECSVFVKNACLKSIGRGVMSIFSDKNVLPVFVIDCIKHMSNDELDELQRFITLERLSELVKN